PRVRSQANSESTWAVAVRVDGRRSNLTEGIAFLVDIAAEDVIRGVGTEHGVSDLEMTGLIVVNAAALVAGRVARQRAVRDGRRALGLVEDAAACGGAIAGQRGAGHRQRPAPRVEDAAAVPGAIAGQRGAGHRQRPARRVEDA